MKRITTLLVSAGLTVVVQSIASPASTEPGRTDRHPVLIAQRGDSLPGADGMLITDLSGPVSAGGDTVAIATYLGNGDDGAIWVGRHDRAGYDLVRASDFGADFFFINRFGVALDPVWGTSCETDLKFVIKARMNNGDDSLLTSWGVVQTVGESGPGLPAGAVITDFKRIQMLLDGQMFWVADWSLEGRSGTALYRRRPGPRCANDLLMNSGDKLCDGVVARLRHFRMAEKQVNGHVVSLETETGSKTALVVDGDCRYSTDQPLPFGYEIPREFWHFDIDSEGRVLFGAVTDAHSSRNGIIALDSDVVMREGNTIDGVRLAPPGATPNEVRLDDRGRAVTLWTNTIDSTFVIFFTPDTSDFSTTRELVSEGSALDFDGDGTLDATLHRFRFFPVSGPTFSLADTGIYIAAYLRYPGSTSSVAAVVFFPF